MGVVDVEGMRDRLGPQQIAKWKAFRHLELSPVDRICEILKRGFCLLAMTEVNPNVLEPTERKRVPEPEATPEQAAKLATASLGQPDGNGNW